MIKNFPLYCPKCKQETVINVKSFIVSACTETVYHCTPYVGAAKSIEAINVVNEVFKEKGIKIPESQATVTEENTNIC